MPVSIDFGSRFKNCTSYELMGNWPAGLSIDSNGLVTGTPAAQGHYPNLYVKGIGEYNVDYTNGFSMDVTAFGALVPDFNGEMKGVLVGTGGLTTTHTSTLYAPDFEGVQRAFDANAPVWAGGRVVTNHMLNSSDATLWNDNVKVDLTAGKTDPYGGTSAVEVSANGNNASVRSIINVGQVGSRITSVWVRRVSGSGYVTIYKGEISSQFEITSLLTTSWQRFTTSGTESSTIGWCGVLLQGIGNVVEVAFAQLENANGRTDATTPSEYVATAATAVQKTFANENGNTVTSNVVTEAVGTPLAEVPYLQYYPAATNSLPYSRDYATWTKFNNLTSAYTEVGITGEMNTASIVTDTSNSAQGYGYKDANVSSGVPVTVVIYLKKVTPSTTNYPSVGGIGVGINARLVVDPVNGTGVWEAGRSGDAYEIISAGLWWKVLVQDASTSAGGLSIYLIPAFNGDGSSTADNTPTGSMIYGNIEVYDNKTIAEVRGLGPIFTTTAAVSTDRTEYRCAGEPFQNESAQYLEVKPTLNSSEAGGSQWITGYGSGTTLSNAVASLYTQTTPRLSSRNGQGYATVELLKDVNNKTGSIWMASLPEAQATKSGTAWPTPQSGFVTLSSGALVFGTVANPAAFGLRECKRYDITSMQEGRDIIDGLMA
jgi:hypothetical protein